MMTLFHEKQFDDKLIKIKLVRIDNYQQFEFEMKNKFICHLLII